MRNSERLSYALIGLVIGLIFTGGAALMISQQVETVEVEVPTIICPPVILEAGGMQLYFGEGANTDLSDLDREFEEACDLEWGPAIPVEDLVPGGSPTDPTSPSGPTDPIDSEPKSPQPEDESA